MRLLLSLLLTACAATSRPRVAAPPATEARDTAQPAAEPRDTAESTPALPALQCPPGTQPVEVPPGPRPPPVVTVIESGIGSCCVGGCEPRREPVWYAATVCRRQFEGLHVVRAVACRSADGAVNGPFVVLANQVRIDGACRGDVLDGPWSWRLDWRSAQARVREEGAFVGGRRDGLWVIASDDGSMVSRGHFVDDERVGMWTTEFFARGALVERRTERHGDDDQRVSESHDPTGALRYRSISRDGQLDGVQERWTDGVRSTTTYAQGRMIARDEWNAGTHTLCSTSVAGDEQCQYRDARGALRIEGRRAAGADHAQWTAWYPTGERLGTTSSRGSVMGGMWATSDGHQRLWYRDGTPLADLTCVDGEARGRAQIWYPDGTRHFDDVAGPPYRKANFQAFAPDGTSSEAAQRCGDLAMSCQLRGSSHRCMALWIFTISVEPYLER